MTVREGGPDRPRAKGLKNGGSLEAWRDFLRDLFAQAKAVLVTVVALLFLSADRFRLRIR